MKIHQWECLYNMKVTYREMQNCMNIELKNYLLYGKQYVEHCSEECRESIVWITAVEARIMFFFNCLALRYVP